MAYKNLISFLRNDLSDALMEIFFPSFCLVCGEKNIHPYLCQSCWEFSRVLETDKHCIFCFDECDSGRLCGTCRNFPKWVFQHGAIFSRYAPILSLCMKENSKAIAGYYYLQWSRLGWEKPDWICSINSSGDHIAKELAALIGSSSPKCFKRNLFQRETPLEFVDFVGEAPNILFINFEGNLEVLNQLNQILMHSCVKKSYTLSLAL
jgi:hypothetical protein